MSNNLVHIETRNQRKLRNTKILFEDAKISNTIKIVNQHNRLHIETDEQYQQYQNKKVKTENNSNNKNAFHAPLISPKNYLKESLVLLKDCASDIEVFQNKQENLDKLRVILDYKYKSRKLVFTKDVFERKLKNDITPVIFAKKNLRIRLNKPETPFLIAFENYLKLVVQLYYKATFQLSDILTEFVPNEAITPQEDPKLIPPPKKPGKRGRKAKPKPVPEQAQQEAQNSELIIPDAIIPTESEDKMQIKKDEESIQLENITFSKVDVLDFLVSPLKVDYIFEKWSPKEIAIFESAICKYGKEFSFIQFLVKTKTINEVIDFYFSWKTTSHYKIWKYYKNIENKLNYNSWL